MNFIDLHTMCNVQHHGLGLQIQCKLAMCILIVFEQSNCFISSFGLYVFHWKCCLKSHKLLEIDCVALGMYVYALNENYLSTTFAIVR